MKKIWISALDKDQEKVQKMMSVVKAYGLGVDGHFWVDDLAKMAWESALEPLSEKDVALWVIMGKAETFQTAAIRQGLSLLALALQHLKGIAFPVMIIPTDGKMEATDLPTLLKGAEIMAAGAAPGPKIVAMANTPVPKTESGYRLNLHAIHGIGLWMEVGPAQGFPWEGAIFGVAGAEITFHGVGPAEGVPERTTLEYAVRGMKVQLGEEDFTAWAVQNQLDEKTSYYVRIQGTPTKFFFGPNATGESAEVHVVAMS